MIKYMTLKYNLLYRVASRYPYFKYVNLFSHFCFLSVCTCTYFRSQAKFNLNEYNVILVTVD